MNDFLTFYEIGEAARAGKNIYAPAPSTGMVVYYLPLFSLVMSIISLLPYKLAALLWTVGKLFSLGLLLRQLSVATPTTSASPTLSKPFPSSLIIVAIASVAASFLADLALGQVNSYITAGFLFFWLSAKKRSTARNQIVAFVFALMACKITPLILIPVVMIKRNWSLAFWMTAYTLLLNGLAAVVIGLPIDELLAGLSLTASENKLSSSELTNVKNQALVAVMGRFYHHYISTTLPQHFPALCFTALSLVFAAALLKSFRAPYPHPIKALSLKEISAAIVVSLLLSPDTRTAHLIQLLIPALFLAGEFLANRETQSRKRLTGRKLASSLLLMGLVVSVGFAGSALIGTSGLHFIRDQNLQTLILVGLAAFCLWNPQNVAPMRYEATSTLRTPSLPKTQSQ